MKIPIYDPFTKRIVGTRSKKVTKDPNAELIQMMQNRYTYIQVNGGRTTFEAMKDLHDGSKRPMPPSMARWIALYGEEWKSISRNARAQAGYRCEECDREFEPVDLHVHHIRPISQFVATGATFTDEHECFGVLTRRPYHTEDNLVVLCKEHHGDRHGRTFR